MQAHDRDLNEWFRRVNTRQITLPRFQRWPAWHYNLIAKLLTAVLRDLPSGSVLVLEVGDKEKFPSRVLADAPTTGERISEQLLDGQQRLTALWKAFNDLYPDWAYLVRFEEDMDDLDSILPAVHSEKMRVNAKGIKLPLWVGKPDECLNNGYIPIRLLRPGDIAKELNEWIESALPASLTETERYEAYKFLRDNVFDVYRTRVREYNLPFLALPAETPKKVAIDVFFNLNTSSVPLTTYDKTVVYVEALTGTNLHDLIQELGHAVPRACEYHKVEELALNSAALRQDRQPGASHRVLDMQEIVDEWDVLIRNISGMVDFLEEESIFDEQRLPSVTPLPVIAALWDFLPTYPDDLDRAKHLLRRYLWKSFLTSRYSKSAATNAHQDFKALRNVLQGTGTESEIPIFEESYESPKVDEIMTMTWPKNKTITGRGLLALQLKCGAIDFSDGLAASVKTITSSGNPREYHHLFPDRLLKDDASLPHQEIFVVPNCALITWRTNRVLSDKDPILYLKKRADNLALGEEELKRRLRTHIVPYSELAVGDYEKIKIEIRADKIRSDYETFLLARSKLLEKAAKIACEGRPLDENKIFE